MKPIISVMSLLSFFYSCSAQNKLCIETFNEGKWQEKIFSTTDDKVYYLFPGGASKEDNGKTYLEGLNSTLQHSNKAAIPAVSDFTIEELDSTKLRIFERFLSDKGFDSKKIFLIRAYSNNKDFLIFEGISITGKKFCKYLQRLSSSQEKETTGLGPTSGNVKLPSDKRIRKLISTYFVLTYRNQNFEYITLN